MSNPFSLKIAPIGKGNYASKMNETVSEEDLAEGIWEINTNKLLEEVRDEVSKQKKETGYIEAEFTPIKKQQSTEWANRTPESKVVSPNSSVRTMNNLKRSNQLNQSKQTNQSNQLNQSKQTNQKSRSRRLRKSRQSRRSRKSQERNTSRKNSK